MTATAYACTYFKGSITISGNAAAGSIPTGWPAAGSSVAWGSGNNMEYCLGGNPTGYAYAPTGSTGTATVTVASHTCGGGSAIGLTNGTYDVNFLNVAAFTNYSNRNWLRDCMSPTNTTGNIGQGVPGVKAADTVKIGTMTVSGGSGTGTYNLNAATSNKTTNPSSLPPTEEAGICVSTPAATSPSEGIEGPITIL